MSSTQEILYRSGQVMKKKLQRFVLSLPVNVIYYYQTNNSINFSMTHKPINKSTNVAGQSVHGHKINMKMGKYPNGERHMKGKLCPIHLTGRRHV